MKAEQAFPEANQSRRDDEGDELVGLGVESETADALPVVAHRPQDAAERRMHDAPNRAAEHDGGTEIVIGKRRVQTVADDALQPVLAAGEIGRLECDFMLGEVKRPRLKVDVAATAHSVYG